MAVLLAQTGGPALDTHFNLIKIGVFAVLFFGWVAVCQWVDRDAEYVKTVREQWNLIVLSGGAAGVLVWLVLPLVLPGLAGFILGLAFWLLLAGGATLAYVFHRNARVVPDARMLTPGHFKRLVSGGGGSKRDRADKGQRVRLADHEGKSAEAPEDADEFEQYAATQEFLFDVLWRRSTDADMIAGKDKVALVYRIDGAALEQPDRVTVEDAERVIAYMKGLAGLNPEERRRPQTGRIQAGLLAKPDLLPVNVQVSGTVNGERLRLQILAGETCKRLGDLGLRDADRQVFSEIIKEPSGLVIVSGPKLSGVTTTQYALIRDHDAFMQNLHTLERTPLLELENITQNAFKKAAGPEMDYARQLQLVLRREPNVVLVGECPDRATAQIAGRAASGDRKIYLAMDSKDAFDALQKYREMLDNNAMLGNAMLAVSNQRLIRILCPACREAFKPDEKLLKKLNLPVDRIEHFFRPPTEPVIDKKGKVIVCQSCQGTGYLGRKGVFEILRVDEKVRAMLTEGAPLQRIKDHYRRLRTPDMWRAGLQEVYDGVTSLDEVLRVLRSSTK
jgi:type II secretory ATPase GspE/PulE/Tfp pilus assembly ATPase PilB-like protein